MPDLVALIRTALDSADLGAFSTLLSPDVTWGAPDDPMPSCQSRAQVLAWYQRGREAGVRAKVIDVAPYLDKIVVGMLVTGNDAADDNGGKVERWQLLTITDGLVSDIRGYDDRASAMAAVGA